VVNHLFHSAQGPTFTARPMPQQPKKAARGLRGFEVFKQGGVKLSGLPAPQSNPVKDYMIGSMLNSLPEP
jgi:hypothetical protein